MFFKFVNVPVGGLSGVLNCFLTMAFAEKLCNSYRLVFAKKVGKASYVEVIEMTNC